MSIFTYLLCITTMLCYRNR